MGEVELFYIVLYRVGWFYCVWWCVYIVVGCLYMLWVSVCYRVIGPLCEYALVCMSMN